MTTTALRAFHGDAGIKRKYLARVNAHAKADRLIRGVGWEGGRGCAIGCTLEAYDHSRYPIELGLPEWLARLEDAIFEGMPKEDAMKWPAQFLRAIKPGVDVEPVRHKLAILRMDRLIALQRSTLGKHGEAIDAVINQTIAAMKQVRRCHEAEAGGNVCDLAVRRSARSAASAAWSAASAAWSAESAARSAAWSAASAAWSAESAARSAASAAWSAESAARSAARSAAWSAAWKQESIDLLKLLRECTP